MWSVSRTSASSEVSVAVAVAVAVTVAVTVSMSVSMSAVAVVLRLGISVTLDDSGISVSGIAVSGMDGEGVVHPGKAVSVGGDDGSGDGGGDEASGEQLGISLGLGLSLSLPLHDSSDQSSVTVSGVGESVAIAKTVSIAESMTEAISVGAETVSVGTKTVADGSNGGNSGNSRGSNESGTAEKLRISLRLSSSLPLHEADTVNDTIDGSEGTSVHMGSGNDQVGVGVTSPDSVGQSGGGRVESVSVGGDVGGGDAGGEELGVGLSISGALAPEASVASVASIASVASTIASSIASVAIAGIRLWRGEGGADDGEDDR